MDTEGNKISYLDAEELASLARRYYAARFPNPERLGCPPPGEIARVVRHRQMPDQALREHLFECSECFGEYRQSLAQFRQPAANEGFLRHRLALIMNQVASFGALKIAATAVLILSSIIILYWREFAPETGKELASSSAPPELRAGDAAQGDGGPASKQTSAVGAGGLTPAGDEMAMAVANIPPKVAKPAETIDVDLDNYQVFRQSLGERASDVTGDRSYRAGAKLRGKTATEPYRSESAEGEKVISLPPTRARMVLRLPETAVPGKYNVSLINAFGKPLLSTYAFSPDGSKLRVALDLRRISSKKCRLRLSRNGEAPAFYDVIIAAK
jgi:hypothetical protein